MPPTYVPGGGPWPLGWGHFPWGKRIFQLLNRKNLPKPKTDVFGGGREKLAKRGPERGKLGDGANPPNQAQKKNPIRPGRKRGSRGGTGPRRALAAGGYPPTRLGPALGRKRWPLLGMGGEALSRGPPQASVGANGCLGPGMFPVQTLHFNYCAAKVWMDRPSDPGGGGKLGRFYPAQKNHWQGRKNLKTGYGRPWVSVRNGVGFA